MRAYYSESLADFSSQNVDSILARLVIESGAPTDEQKHAWQEQIILLKRELGKLDEHNSQSHVCFEFVIPRMGKRADAIVVYAGMLFVLEFKVGAGQYARADKEQCMGYALDMKNFHEASHDLYILPILVATGAGTGTFDPDSIYDDNVFEIACSDGSDLGQIISDAVKRHPSLATLDPRKWEESAYKPTPTIIEAARALYNNHDVRDITRSTAGATNLTKTKDAIERVIQHSKDNSRKSICFVTGIPGAGKTLAGLNLTVKPHNTRTAGDAGAVFLSGNGPLVNVLREALARDKHKRDRANQKRDPSAARTTKKDAQREAGALIQPIREFILEAMKKNAPPHEKIVIFDEAQRAWTRDALDKFMRKRGRTDGVGMSQPEYVMSVMSRHRDWAVLVCLVGGGQEINSGEAGMSEWFDSLRRGHHDWDVYVSPEINGVEYLGETYDNSRQQIKKMLDDKTRLQYLKELHLDTSVRSFKSKHVSEFVRLLLECDIESAYRILPSIAREYPIKVTRDFEQAKKWLQKRARGTDRFGIVAAAKSYRLRPFGIYVELTVDAIHWFLDPSDDPRSSNSLEYAATEFEIQGLELDWACVAWDADLRHDKNGWMYREFRGDKWTNVRKDYKQRYLKNAYRVLLTRARQGMIIFVPCGNDADNTRDPAYYDRTYEYLRTIGIPELAHE